MFADSGMEESKGDNSLIPKSSAMKRTKGADSSAAKAAKSIPSSSSTSSIPIQQKDKEEIHEQPALTSSVDDLSPFLMDALNTLSGFNSSMGERIGKSRVLQREATKKLREECLRSQTAYQNFGEYAKEVVRDGRALLDAMAPLEAMCDRDRWGERMISGEIVRAELDTMKRLVSANMVRAKKMYSKHSILSDKMHVKATSVEEELEGVPPLVESSKSTRDDATAGGGGKEPSKQQKDSDTIPLISLAAGAPKTVTISNVPVADVASHSKIQSLISANLQTVGLVSQMKKETQAFANDVQTEVMAMQIALQKSAGDISDKVNQLRQIHEASVEEKIAMESSFLKAAVLLEKKIESLEDERKKLVDVLDGVLQQLNSEIAANNIVKETLESERSEALSTITKIEAQFDALCKKSEEDIVALRGQYETELEALQTKSQMDLEKAMKQGQDDLDALHAQSETEAAALEKRYNAEMEAMCKKNKADVDALHDQIFALKELHQRELDTVKLKAKADIEALEALKDQKLHVQNEEIIALNGQIAKLLQQHVEEMGALKEQSKTDILTLENQQKIQMDAREKEYEGKIKECEKTHEGLLEELKVINAKVDELRKELEDSNESCYELSESLAYAQKEAEERVVESETAQREAMRLTMKQNALMKQISALKESLKDLPPLPPPPPPPTSSPPSPLSQAQGLNGLEITQPSSTPPITHLPHSLNDVEVEEVELIVSTTRDHLLAYSSSLTPPPPPSPPSHEPASNPDSSSLQNTELEATIGKQSEMIADLTAQRDQLQEDLTRELMDRETVCKKADESYNDYLTSIREHEEQYTANKKIDELMIQGLCQEINDLRQSAKESSQLHDENVQKLRELEEIRMSLTEEASQLRMDLLTQRHSFEAEIATLQKQLHNAMDAQGNVHIEADELRAEIEKLKTLLSNATNANANANATSVDQPAVNPPPYAPVLTMQSSKKDGMRRASSSSEHIAASQAPKPSLQQGNDATDMVSKGQSHMVIKVESEPLVVKTVEVLPLSAPTTPLPSPKQDQHEHQNDQHQHQHQHDQHEHQHHHTYKSTLEISPIPPNHHHDGEVVAQSDINPDLNVSLEALAATPLPVRRSLDHSLALSELKGGGAHDDVSFSLSLTPVNSSRMREKYPPLPTDDAYVQSLKDDLATCCMELDFALQSLENESMNRRTVTASAAAAKKAYEEEIATLSLKVEDLTKEISQLQASLPPTHKGDATVADQSIDIGEDKGDISTRNERHKDSGTPRKARYRSKSPARTEADSLNDSGIICFGSGSNYNILHTVEKEPGDDAETARLKDIISELEREIRICKKNAKTSTAAAQRNATAAAEEMRSLRAELADTQLRCKELLQTNVELQTQSAEAEAEYTEAAGLLIKTCEAHRLGQQHRIEELTAKLGAAKDKLRHARDKIITLKTALAKQKKEYSEELEEVYCQLLTYREQGFGRVISSPSHRGGGGNGNANRMNHNNASSDLRGGGSTSPALLQHEADSDDDTESVLSIRSEEFDA